MKIYIVGFNGFIGKNLYLNLKQSGFDIILLSHNEIDLLIDTTFEDIVINCAGVNKSVSEEDFDKGNYLFLDKLVENVSEKNVYPECGYSLKNKPFLIHLSSLMVYGFEDVNHNDLPLHHKWFIESKLKGEKFLIDRYNNDKLCIIRPSNVYGYNCQPYYNNLLTTLVYEKINNYQKINKLNSNCIRNMISVDSLCNEISNIIKNKTHGVFNIISDNNASLSDMIENIYNDIPDHIQIENGPRSVFDLNNENIIGKSIVVSENFNERINKLEENMRRYYVLIDITTRIQKDYLSQSRGDMVEISSLNAKRLYKITINQHSIRGNHFHYKQIEDFYINSGKVTFVLALADYPEVVQVFHGIKDELVTVKPGIIHTVCNDFLNNIPEIIISSTQEFIPNEIPDTKYVNIL